MIYNFGLKFRRQYGLVVLGAAIVMFSSTGGLVCAQSQTPPVITGQVIDNFGVPVAQVAVQVRTSKDRVLFTVFTDNNGVFQFYNLPPGDFRIVLVIMGNAVSKEFAYAKAMPVKDIGPIRFLRP